MKSECEVMKREINQFSFISTTNAKNIQDLQESDRFSLEAIKNIQDRLKLLETNNNIKKNANVPSQKQNNLSFSETANRLSRINNAIIFNPQIAHWVCSTHTFY